MTLHKRTCIYSNNNIINIPGSMQAQRQVPSINEIIDLASATPKEQDYYIDDLRISTYDQPSINQLENRVALIEPSPFKTQLERAIQNRKDQLKDLRFNIDFWSRQHQIKENRNSKKKSANNSPAKATKKANNSLEKSTQNTNNSSEKDSKNANISQAKGFKRQKLRSKLEQRSPSKSRIFSQFREFFNLPFQPFSFLSKREDRQKKVISAQFYNKQEEQSLMYEYLKQEKASSPKTTTKDKAQ